MFYRFLIVDDEYYIRQHIRYCIDWEKLGFQFAGEASSAAQAKELLNERPVELMILDISMPGQNGMELLGSLAPEKIPHTIILSGFATFDYAKEAIKYGVHSYLLKPVNPAELTSAVENIRKQLDAQTAYQNERRQYQHTSQVIFQETQNTFFRHLFSGDIPQNSIQMLEKYGIQPNLSYYLIILDVYSKDVLYPSYEQRQSWHQAIQNLIPDIFQKNSVCLTVQDSYSHSIVLWNSNESPEKIANQLRIFKEAICSQLHLQLLCGYSFCPNAFPEKLRHGYYCAIEFFRFRSIYSKDTHKIQTKLPDVSILDSLNTQNSQLKTQLFNRNKHNAADIIHNIFTTICHHLLPLQALESELFSLLSIAMHYCAMKKLDIMENEENYIAYNCSEMIRAGISIHQMENKYLRLFEMLADSSENEEGQFIEALVFQAVKIINKNFAQAELGLNTIARDLLISPSYLSRSFTKIQGISLTGYLTQRRLENASRLLVQTTLSIAQISEQSGYNDLFYFSKRFKSYFGVSPTKYRTKSQKT